MSSSKMGRNFPKMGKVLPERNAAGCYALAISRALRDDVGDTHNTIKTVAKWTGASERTVKNWFAGTSGPSGEHLIALARYSDDVFEALLLLSGREPWEKSAPDSLICLRDRLSEALHQVQFMCRSQHLSDAIRLEGMKSLPIADGN